MAAAALPILESFSALADPTRCRMLLLLDRHELTVSELCSVLQLPQSTVSRHLKTLSDADWVASRRDGTSRYYALALDAAGGPRSVIWDLTRGQLLGRAGTDIGQDTRRLERVLARRTEASKQFFASAASQWDRVREELFGREAFPKAILSLLPGDWVVGDLGCGTGSTSSLLAPHVRRVIGIDSSEEMLAAAKTRLKGVLNVELHRGALEALPIDSRELDAAVFVLVLHHLPTPTEALVEAARTLKPGGRLLIVDMMPHEDEKFRHQMGHVWLGFSEEQMRRWLTQCGFEDVRVDPLPPAADATGPALFAAVGIRK
jgi:ArsR family transcriptional regulator